MRINSIGTNYRPNNVSHNKANSMNTVHSASFKGVNAKEELQTGYKILADIYNLGENARRIEFENMIKRAKSEIQRYWRGHTSTGAAEKLPTKYGEDFCILNNGSVFSSDIPFEAGKLKLPKSGTIYNKDGDMLYRISPHGDMQAQGDGVILSIKDGLNGNIEITRVGETQPAAGLYREGKNFTLKKLKPDGTYSVKTTEKPQTFD